jgi:hypothetical protein
MSIASDASPHSFSSVSVMVAVLFPVYGPRIAQLLLSSSTPGPDQSYVLRFQPDHKLSSRSPDKLFLLHPDRTMPDLKKDCLWQLLWNISINQFVTFVNITSRIVETQSVNIISAWCELSVIT